MPRSNDFCESTQPEDSCQASQSARERKRGEGDGGWQKIKIGSAQNRLTQLARPFATSIHSERDSDGQTDRHANSAISRAKICPKIRWAIFRERSPIRDVRYNLNFQIFDPLRLSAFGPDLAFELILSLSSDIIYAWSPRMGLME